MLNLEKFIANACYKPVITEFYCQIAVTAKSTENLPIGTI